MQKYTNSFTPSAFALFKGPYNVERLANAGSEQRQIFESHVEEMKDCSLVAIWRFATAGSLSLNGGKVEQASANESFTLKDGDVIISTPQDFALLCQLDSSPAMPANFLTPVTF